jgi:hypothetical protein
MKHVLSLVLISMIYRLLCMTYEVGKYDRCSLAYDAPHRLWGISIIGCNLYMYELKQESAI